MDKAAELAFNCHKRGFSEGSDLLARLQRSEISVDEFDESRERERAREIQGRKSFGFEEGESACRRQKDEQ